MSGLLSFLLQFFLVKDFLKEGFLAIYKVKQKEWAPQKEFFLKKPWCPDIFTAAQ